jgi:WD repeat-containing protein 24
VRDVQFNPANPFEFIAAFENGNIQVPPLLSFNLLRVYSSLQKWDIRFPHEPERRWSAHFGLALTIDWHPDGRYVASAGRDRVIKVQFIFVIF